MKLLLDECLPHRLRAHLVGHDPYTVTYMGWDGIKNGRLLALAVGSGFEAFLTTDRNIEYQQNLSTLPLPIVVMEAMSNDISDLFPVIPQLLTVLANPLSQAVTHVR